MAMTAQVKAELATVKVTKPCCRKSEVAHFSFRRGKWGKSPKFARKAKGAEYHDEAGGGEEYQQE